MTRLTKIADLFAGAGGTSTGAIRAAHRLGLSLDMLAVNHWPTAVATHELNHPSVRHLCADLNALDPLKVSGKLDLLIASPECVHHSIARGGKPMDDQSRSSAWHVLHWMDKCKPESVFIENVREWKDWGPLNDRNRPLKSRKGELFKNFCQSVEALGYTLDWKLVNAADFGDATTRTRLIMLIKRGRNRKIKWPKQTHSSTPFGDLKQWRPARDVIDWSLQGKSIYDRKIPLKPNTMRRIMAGMKKFNVAFLIQLRGTADDQIENSARSADDPLSTITGSGAHHALCQPFLLPTVAGAGAISLIQPFLIQAGGPTGTGRNPRSVNSPLSTVMTENHTGVVEPFLIQMDHTKSEDSNMVHHTGKGAHSVDEPLGTITTKDRFVLVMPDGSKAKLDIRFRMLQPHELSAAMGFPKDYQFAGNRGERVKQIGNAVAVNLADAHVTALLNN